jgi:hypothetical protein
MPEPTRSASPKLASVCALWLACWLTQPAAAEPAPAPPAAQQPAGPQPSQTGLPPDYVWAGASATLLTASLGGLFALRVHTLYDEALRLPGVSPERLVLKEQMQQAELTADCLFAAAVLLATTTVILALFTEWGHPARQPERAALRLLPVASHSGARLVLQGVLP